MGVFWFQTQPLMTSCATHSKDVCGHRACLLIIICVEVAGVGGRLLSQYFPVPVVITLLDMGVLVPDAAATHNITIPPQ